MFQPMCQQSHLHATQMVILSFFESPSPRKSLPEGLRPQQSHRLVFLVALEFLLSALRSWLCTPDKNSTTQFLQTHLQIMDVPWISWLQSSFHWHFENHREKMFDMHRSLNSKNMSPTEENLKIRNNKNRAALQSINNLSWGHSSKDAWLNSVAVLEEEERLQWKYLLDDLIELICCKLSSTKRVGVVVCSGIGVQNLEEINCK